MSPATANELRSSVEALAMLDSHSLPPSSFTNNNNRVESSPINRDDGASKGPLAPRLQTQQANSPTLPHPEIGAEPLPKGNKPPLQPNAKGKNNTKSAKTPALEPILGTGNFDSLSTQWLLEQQGTDTAKRAPSQPINNNIVYTSSNIINDTAGLVGSSDVVPMVATLQPQPTSNAHKGLKQPAFDVSGKGSPPEEQQLTRLRVNETMSGGTSFELDEKKRNVQQFNKNTKGSGKMCVGKDGKLWMWVNEKGGKPFPPKEPDDALINDQEIFDPSPLPPAPVVRHSVEMNDALPMSNSRDLKEDSYKPVYPNEGWGPSDRDARRVRDTSSKGRSGSLMRR